MTLKIPKKLKQHHHKDPFDRIIIAAAKINDMGVMTSDTIFETYGLEIINSRVR